MAFGAANNAKYAKNIFVKMIITNRNINCIRIANITMTSLRALRALRFSRQKIHMSEVMNRAFVMITVDSEELKADG
jgi:ribosomal protein L30E